MPRRDPHPYGVDPVHDVVNADVEIRVLNKKFFRVGWVDSVTGLVGLVHPIQHPGDLVLEIFFFCVFDLFGHLGGFLDAFELLEHAEPEGVDVGGGFLGVFVEGFVEGVENLG